MRNRLYASLPAYLFSLPVLVFIGLFMAYPLITSFWMSLTDYHLIYPEATRFVGLDNFRNALSDPNFRCAVVHTMIYALFYVTVVVGLSMFLAILIQSAGRFGRVCQTLIFIPVLIPQAMGAVIFVWLLSERFGLINNLIGTVLGATFAKNWLGEPGWAMAAIVLASYWPIGVSVVLFAAALAGIPRSLYEAAAVDGAGPWARFRAVTLPSLRHTTAVVSILSIIAGLKVFALPFVMTKGGPGTSTLMLYHWIFKNAFEYYKLGYACAMAYLLALIVLVVAGGRLILSRENSG